MRSPAAAPGENRRQDRLSALIHRFELQVEVAESDAANLLLLTATDDHIPTRLVFGMNIGRQFNVCAQESIVFAARVHWGGDANPLLAALPDSVNLAIDRDTELDSLGRLLIAESRAPRCGAETILAKLGEVLLVKLLRTQIEIGAATAGLLGGLADPRLSRAIVAVHEAPGQPWNNHDLADMAGLSLSRFVELFRKTVGQTPMSYVRHWRMVLARQDIQRGDRIQVVAKRYGYASSEALGRAFRREYNTRPTAMRAAVHSTADESDQPAAV